MASLALSAMLAGIQSCTPVGPPIGTYTINTFRFVLSNPPQNDGEAIPNIWNDTNTKLSSLSGGSLTSSLPCAVMIDYTNNSFSFKSAVITGVTITYDDDTTDPSTKMIKFPLQIDAREYESVNSVAGGRIVKSRNQIISGRIPDVVTRAEPFRLQIDGYFTQDEGRRVPITIDQHFEIEREDAIKSAAEVLQDK
jgi:hypothetical protein